MEQKKGRLQLNENSTNAFSFNLLFQKVVKIGKPAGNLLFLFFVWVGKVTVNSPKKLSRLRQITKNRTLPIQHQLHKPHISPPQLAIPTWHSRRVFKSRRAFFNFLLRRSKKIARKILGLFLIFNTPFRIGALVSLVLIAGFAYSIFLINISKELPNPDNLTADNKPLTTEIYDRNGALLYRMYEDRNREIVPLNQIPQNLINATVAIEDKNFWTHHGVDIFGVFRALLADSKQGQTLQGGSTITQQLVKNNILDNEQTWQRKIKEAALAFWTERLYSKQEILHMYFNSIPYGGPAWGAQAAAQTYFNKDVKDLDLAESAYLAGLPASPTTYSPFGPHPEYGKQRQAEVLRRMVEDGYITQAQANTALSEQLAFTEPVDNIKAPHFVMYVRSLLAEKYGEKYISQAGLKVYTSLDLNIQKMAEDAVTTELNKLGDEYHITNGAAMVEDPNTGQILAMVGSRDYFDPNNGNFNVTLALRQPGSSIKPVTYATAFKQGYSPGTIVMDTPTAWGSYAPVNYDGRFHGAVTMREALGSSFNVPAVKTLNMVGIPAMLQTAKDLGINTFNEPDKYGLSLTLGSAEVTMADMMTAYSTFADMGIRHDSTPILKIVDSQGNVLEDNTHDPGIRVLSPGVSFMIDNVLSDNNARAPEFGTNSQLYIPGYTVAAKTGTTNEVKDNWTFGFTPNYTVGVWVGNNDNSPMNQSLVSGITGAAPIWNDIMTKLIVGTPNIAFNRPAEVVNGIVDGHQDLVIDQHLAEQDNLYTPNKKVQAPVAAKGILSLTDFFTADSSGTAK